MLETEDLAQQLADWSVRSAQARGESRRQRALWTPSTNCWTLPLPRLRKIRRSSVFWSLSKQIRAAEPEANILIYTEYVDSLDSLALPLRNRWGTRVLTMTGELGEADRRRVTERFRSESSLLLLSTDASAEGLNLHQRCHHLIHLELPFNPNRLEQRNGRIDRYGQNFDPQVRTYSCEARSRSAS